MVGTPIGEMRTAVLERLRSTACCTYLNDALRALAEVPVLARYLDDAVAAEGHRAGRKYSADTFRGTKK